MVIPDTQAHLNGHAVLTFTYSIFLDDGLNAPQQSRSKESTLHLEVNNDPRYCGHITFEKPGHLFQYTADGVNELNSDEVQEIIENLSHVRDNPSLWGQLEG
ncbi:MAG: hypothetical protein NVSMB24_14050 [Mucilaginibacter sp.]